MLLGQVSFKGILIADLRLLWSERVILRLLCRGAANPTMYHQLEANNRVPFLVYE